MRNAEDESLARVLAITLRAGVLLALAAGATGAALYLATSTGAPVRFHDFQGSTAIYAHPGAVLRQAFTTAPVPLHERGASLAEVGIFCLVLTPVLRVVLSFVGFLKERDWIYVGITAAVLGSLTWSLLLR